MDDEVPILNSCRICFEENPPFVSPCACTSKVHLACLNQWRYQFPVDHVKRQKCEVCLQAYNLLEVKLERWRAFALFLFWGTLSFFFIGAMPYIVLLLPTIQILLGWIALFSFWMAHTYFNRVRKRLNRWPLLVNVLIMLCVGLVVFYIIQLPEQDSVLIYTYIVFGTYMILHVISWICISLNQRCHTR